MKCVRVTVEFLADVPDDVDPDTICVEFTNDSYDDVHLVQGTDGGWKDIDATILEHETTRIDLDNDASAAAK